MRLLTYTKTSGYSLTERYHSGLCVKKYLNCKKSNKRFLILSATIKSLLFLFRLLQVKYALLSFRGQLKPESRPNLSPLEFAPVRDRDHFLGLKVNDFPLFLTSCKRRLDAFSDLCIRYVHYAS